MEIAIAVGMLQVQVGTFVMHHDLPCYSTKFWHGQYFHLTCVFVLYFLVSPLQFLATSFTESPLIHGAVIGFKLFYSGVNCFVCYQSLQNRMQNVTIAKPS